MQFITHAKDINGMAALDILNKAGYDTLVLVDGEKVDEQSIALFTPINEDKLQGTRGKYLRTSCVKLTNEFAPTWAHSTNFRIGTLRQFRSEKDQHRDSKFPTSVINMAKEYETWLAEGSSRKVPWSNYEIDPAASSNAEYTELVNKWLTTESVSQFRRIWIIKKGAQRAFNTLQLQGWRVNYTDEAKIFPVSAAGQAVKALGEWKKYFPIEKTWIQQAKQIPSLIVRFDCVVDDDGRLIIYEIEERPAGIGLSGMISEPFAQELTRVAKTWEPFKVLVSPKRKASDDAMWQKYLPWNGDEHDLVLIRAEPEENDFHHLESMSVSSLKSKGDKSYGEGMGLWHRVSSISDLGWDKSFVLKPLQGSKLRDLEIWDPQKRPGSSVRSKVETSLAKNRTMFCQQFYPPMLSGWEQFPWMIFRIFAGYNFVIGEWEILGGNWNARYNLRMHGASDALFGKAVVG